jgi:hypothetical protein
MRNQPAHVLNFVGIAVIESAAGSISVVATMVTNLPKSRDGTSFAPNMTQLIFHGRK